MNWEKGHELYSKIQELETQRENLTDLAQQIADDRREITITIQHSQYQPPRQQGYGIMDMMMGGYQTKLHEKDSVDIEPVILTLKDEKALAYIGHQLYFIDELIDNLNSELKQL